MSIRRDLHEENRAAWNAATPAHNAHKRDQAGLLRSGGSTLFPEEIELCGDLGGKRLLHLQCNSGQDTLSLAHLGAEVTGVDISDEAIAFARELSSASGLPGTFVRADVFDWLAEAVHAPARWDVVFASYGALGWLSDLTTWARGVAGVLAHGGRLCVMEFHPVLMCFDANGARTYPYFGDGRVFTEAQGVHDYVADAGCALWPWGFEPGDGTRFVNPHAGHMFQWTIADVLTAVTDAGLAIDTFREYPYSNGFRAWTRMRALDGRRFTVPEGEENLPMMYALGARRP